MAALLSPARKSTPHHQPVAWGAYVLAELCTAARAGDQADQKLLDTILAEAKEFGGYDVIIDDGGHTCNQMLTSIKVCELSGHAD